MVTDTPVLLSAARYEASMPLDLAKSADEKLQRAYRSYLDGQGAGTRHLVSAKLDILGHYDVPGMKEAAALCCWGRSGSLLLASYLDGHNDIVMMPMIKGEKIYHFFREYEALSVWEKLVAYPTYAEYYESSFFDGEFPIVAEDYYASVHALFKVYGNRPVEWLQSRSRFFQFLHVAYAVAIGQRPDSPHPVMVYSQHWTDDDLACRFIEDFPNGRFMHTIRDPIASFDSWFDRLLDMQTTRCPIPKPEYLKTALDTVRHLIGWDRSHLGMEGRTCAIRFEDLHLTPMETMRDLAQWLGVPYRPSLLESTFNGAPYVVGSGKAAWTGPNPANAVRRSKNLNWADRLMMFALLQENFDAWNYGSPRAFRHRAVRLVTIALLLLVPMKMEAITAKAVMRVQVLPLLRAGKIVFAGRTFLRLFACRWALMKLVATEARTRLLGGKRVLTLL